MGYRQVETNARGRILRVLEQKPPVPGETLRLTLDMDVQRAADEALGDRRGAVVLREGLGRTLRLIFRYVMRKILRDLARLIFRWLICFCKL